MRKNWSRIMIARGLIRPLVVVAIAWLLSTRQMVRKHSDPPKEELLLLHPAYTLFYTVFVSAGFLFAYHEFDRRLPEDPANRCAEYHGEISEKFGFIAQAGPMIYHLFIVYAINTAVAVFYGFYLKRVSTEQLTRKGFEKHLYRYAIASLCVSVLVYGLLFAAAWMRGDRRGEEGEVGEVGPGCVRGA
jgi:hypothetical protein